MLYYNFRLFLRYFLYYCFVLEDKCVFISISFLDMIVFVFIILY